MTLLTANDVRGIFPPLITPLHDDEEVNFEQFKVEVARMLELPITGAVIGGSTGEGFAMSPEELAELTRITVEMSAGRIPVVTGIITTTTRDAIVRGKLAREAGAIGLMVTAPVYQRPTAENLIAYFDAVHKGTGLPIIIYNVLPGGQIPPDTIRRLLEVPGVIATKESAGSTLGWLSELVDTVGDEKPVTWATDDLLYPGLALGACGSISGTSALFPEETIAMWDAIQRNDYRAALRIHYALSPLMREIMCGYNWPGLMKATLNLMGRNAGPARSPFTAPGPEQHERLKVALEKVQKSLAVGELTTA